MKRLVLIATAFLASLIYVKAQGASVASLDKSFETFVNSTPDSTLFKVYCGTYVMQENPFISEVNLFVKNGKLMCLSPDEDEIVLQPLDEKDTFTTDAVDVKVVFLREKDNIVGLKAIGGGKAIEGKKK